MGAIAGVFGAAAEHPLTRQRLDRMLAVLARRGPGAPALQLEPGAALGARRLRLAADERGARLYESADGRFAMVAEGRLFDAPRIGDGRGDGLEQLLSLCVRIGPEALAGVDGQFALALWDRQTKTFTFARDPFGVRSLYWAVLDDGVVFSSEIKALLCHPSVESEIDPIALSDYLTYLNVPPPRTLLRGIRKLPPGAIARARLGETPAVLPYFDLSRDPIPEKDDRDWYVRETRERHRRAVERRLVDGRIGALLSGGNDSSANVALVSRSGRCDVHTFTVGLAEVEGSGAYSDAQYARRVAELYGTRHTELLLDIHEFVESIPPLFEVMDDLVSEPSSIFLRQALELAHSEGLSVVITGEANDELCCGHAEMIRIRDGYYQRWLPYRKLPRLVRELAAKVAPLISPARAEVLERAARGREYFVSFETAWMDSEKHRIMAPELLEIVAEHRSLVHAERDAERLRRSAHGARDYLAQIVYRMMQSYYFGNLMLSKLELLSASCGVEARCPYTATDYAHLAFNVPARFKTEGGQVKAFFRRAIADLLPESVVSRKKQGFRTPVVELFRGELAEQAAPWLLELGLSRTGWLRRDALELLLREHRADVRDHSNRLWTVMALNLWYERWVAGRRATRPAPRELATAVS